jgi:hypothetical protein
MNDISDTAPTSTSTAFADLITLARLFADPQALQVQLDAFAARDTKSRDLEASARRAVQAMQNERAALDAEKAALDERRKEYDAEGERWSARKAELDAQAVAQSKEGRERYFRKQIEHAKNRDQQTRRQVMRISRLDQGYNEILQSFPDWDQITAALLDGQGDAHDIDGTEHLGADADFAAEHALPSELPADVIAGSTLTQRGGHRGGAGRRAQP